MTSASRTRKDERTAKGDTVNRVAQTREPIAFGVENDGPAP